MAFHKPSRRRIRSFCAEVHPDDGVDPRLTLRQGRAEKAMRRKSRQLCGQVAEALGQVLAGELGDDVLRDLQVVSVEPAPDTSRLLVTVRVEPPSEAATPVRVLEHLGRASGRLRSEVASAITRRRAPVLVYCVEFPSRG